MKVKVRIFGDVAAVIGNSHVVELDEYATILTLIETIRKSAGQTRRGYLGEFKVGGGDLAIVMNGKNIMLLDGVDTVLNDGDDVVILPFASGG